MIRLCIKPEQFCRYVESRLKDRDFAVLDIGAHFHVSNRYVRYVFRTSGESPSQYLIRRRLELAHQMLLDPALRHLTILTIALECGFGGPEHFSRSFRSKYRIAPRVLRKSARERPEHRFIESRL